MKRNLNPEQRAALTQELDGVRSEIGAIRNVFESRLSRRAEWQADEERRRARLRRVSFGLLGR